MRTVAQSSRQLPVLLLVAAGAATAAAVGAVATAAQVSTTSAATTPAQCKRQPPVKTPGASSRDVTPDKGRQPAFVCSGARQSPCLAGFRDDSSGPLNGEPNGVATASSSLGMSSRRGGAGNKGNGVNLECDARTSMFVGIPSKYGGVSSKGNGTVNGLDNHAPTCWATAVDGMRFFSVAATAGGAGSASTFALQYASPRGVVKPAVAPRAAAGLRGSLRLVGRAV